MNDLTRAGKYNIVPLLLEASLLENDILMTSWLLHFQNNYSDLQSGQNLTNPKSTGTGGAGHLPGLAVPRSVVAEPSSVGSARGQSWMLPFHRDVEKLKS